MSTASSTAPSADANAAPVMPASALVALLGQHLGAARLDGPDALPITGVAPLERATEGDLSFIREQKHAHRWAESRASAALVTDGVDVPGHNPAERALIYVPSADLAMIALLDRFQPAGPARAPGVHPSAVVHPTAAIDDTAHIGPNCVLDEAARVGANATLIASVHIGANARVGSHTTLHPGVVLGDRCRVGASTTIHANVAIGGDGFGYVPHPETKLPVKVPHIGAVTIGDHVEIGAGATIDRGKLDDTIIADHVKLDNMVQIAHNVRIGLGTIICAQCGIAGSVTIGKGAVIGAQCGIADNRTLGDGVQLAAKTGVMKDLPPGQIYGGIPSEPGAYWLKAHAAIKKLAPHAGTLAAIAKKSGDA